MYKKLKSTFFKKTKIKKIKKLKLDDLNQNLIILSKTDFLNLDIEGFDLQVLKQIDLKRSKIKLAAIETHYPEGDKTKDCDAILNLESEKYRKKLFV